MALMLKSGRAGLTYAGGTFGGSTMIAGSTAVVGVPTNTPVKRRVRLHHQGTGAVVRDTWSDPVTGQYRFGWLATSVYYVIGFDHTAVHGGVIETGVAPEPMP